mmetsp:Transcript_39325/g.80602  ORF Transcript_39325/g.80602 Transcript_39325/m.80602 type:complete len:210 (-) Transcript_39325:1208-1837(-)|eukprot:CAMPEP_0178727036 /NCGR_PEP_ID=MMETSP0699-20121125/27646_1 /TAXON_ID=265572 /ORGANISM="Extubocellulus spinifer, Strain CCMP396" /LENGTH=209 /DNA_ID=CAMNT_0020378717 /DNA_START=2760 /DNA_END=3389 /DNA_ORIENTATION=+
MAPPMEDIIKRCTETADFVSKQEIPKSVWEACAGVVIINSDVVGFGFSVGEGAGVVIKKNEGNTWGAPSCVHFTSGAVGAVLGVGSKKIVLFPMTKYGLEQFTADNRFELGAQFDLAAGKFGRELDFGVAAGEKGANITVSYVFSDGGLLEVGVNSTYIDRAFEANEKFYGKNVAPGDIVFKEGAVDIPAGKGVEELHAKLTECCKRTE